MTETDHTEPNGPGVVEGEGASGDIVGRKFAGSRPRRQVVDGVGHAAEAEPVGMLDIGDNQAIGGSHGQTKVDVLLDDDLVSAPLAVDKRMLAQGFDRRERDKSHE